MSRPPPPPRPCAGCLKKLSNRIAKATSQTRVNRNRNYTMMIAIYLYLSLCMNKIAKFKKNGKNIHLLSEVSLLWPITSARNDVAKLCNHWSEPWSLPFHLESFPEFSDARRLVAFELKIASPPGGLRNSVPRARRQNGAFFRLYLQLLWFLAPYYMDIVN